MTLSLIVPDDREVGRPDLGGYRAVMVQVRDDAGEAARTKAAIDIGHRYRAQVVGVQVTAISDYLPAGPLEGIQVFRGTADTATLAQERLRKAFAARLTSEGLDGHYAHSDGDAAATLIHQAKLADLVILSLPGWSAGRRRRLELIGEVANASRVPVLAVPDDLTTLRGDHVAIAWNGSFEAARAVKAALPMLQRATKVTILTVDDDATIAPPPHELARYLGRHGIAAGVEMLLPDNCAPAQVLRAWLDANTCDCLVMGLYGHSRLREFLLSGVSRSMLLESRVPLFISH